MVYEFQDEFQYNITRLTNNSVINNSVVKQYQNYFYKTLTKYFMQNQLRPC